MAVCCLLFVSSDPARLIDPELFLVPLLARSIGGSADDRVLLKLFSLRSSGRLGRVVNNAEVRLQNADEPAVHPG